jgi:hypothetical protein
MVAPPSYNFFFLKASIKKKKWHLRVADVKIRQFWTEKLTEVPSLSFSITTCMKKMKTESVKNEVFKSQGCVRYLILIFTLHYSPQLPSSLFTFKKKDVKDPKSVF